jgi:hypothetical protein
MTELTKETITTQNNNEDTVRVAPVVRLATSSQTVEYLVYFLFGALEVLLVFRLVLKLAGANVYSAFVGLVYGITGVFILPFENIFRQGVARVAQTTSVFEPSTLVAIFVYSVIAWGIVKLIRVLSGEKQAA